MRCGRGAGWGLGLALVVVIASLWSWAPHPSFAAGSALEPLTVELLAQRLAAPRTSAGLQTLDLSHLRINLEEPELRDHFYRQLREQMERQAQPLGLDLSQSVIQGDLALTQLAQTVPLVAEALATLLTPTERDRLPADLQQLRPPGVNPEQVSPIKLLRWALKLKGTRILGAVQASNLVLLQPVQAEGVVLQGPVIAPAAYVAREVQAAGAVFSQTVNWTGSQFAGPVWLTNSEFQGALEAAGTQFQAGGDFSGSTFLGASDWRRSHWSGAANFAQTAWRDRLRLSKSRFLSQLDFGGATFEQAVALRSARFNGLVQLSEASLLQQLDFSDAVFTPQARVLADGLAFDADTARLLGDRNRIGQVLQLSGLPGNEAVFGNLIRNFRRLEQVGDANRLEYSLQQLRLQQLFTRIRGTPRDWRFLWRQGPTLAVWAGLNVLLLLSNYGTNAHLVLSCGAVMVAGFSVLIWGLDRWRGPQSPLHPRWPESAWMVGSAVGLLLLGGMAIAQTSTHPVATLLCLGLLLLPGLVLAAQHYRQGRGGVAGSSGTAGPRRAEPYLLENGGERQWGLGLVRLPVVPKFPFYRDRYTPIPWNRRLNWLNYYGFSLNMFLKLSFNDLRLRDEGLPSAISAITWYQWSLGLLYSVLLFWTLSRTIPGLNLLLYLS